MTETPAPSTFEAAPSPVAISGKRARLSPLNQRRLANFRANRRGYWSFWTFIILFVISLGAELFTGDRPLIVVYKGEVLFPILVDYPEEKFGGFLATTDYRDRGTAEEITQNGFMIWPPIRYGYRTVRNDGGPFPAPPTWYKYLSRQTSFPWLHYQGPSCAAGAGETALPLDCEIGNWNWLGTDVNGRDVVARITYGFRLSILFGLILTVISSIVGVAAGAVQGYFGGWTDLLMQRFFEVWNTIPELYVLIILAAVLAPGFWVLLGILLLFQWVALVPLVRAEFLRARNFEYVQAARGLGVSSAMIIWRHVLPNAMVSTLTYMPFILSASITALTSLDFLGFGLPPGSPSIGELLAEGKENPTVPWLALTGFTVMAVMLSLLIFIGEAVRDALDPRKTFR